jgi:hypothetical protein
MGTGEYTFHASTMRAKFLRTEGSMDDDRGLFDLDVALSGRSYMAASRTAIG